MIVYSLKKYSFKALLFLFILQFVGCTQSASDEYSINYNPTKPFKTVKESSKITENSLPNNDDSTYLSIDKSFEIDEIEIQTSAKPVAPSQSFQVQQQSSSPILSNNSIDSKGKKNKLIIEDSQQNSKNSYGKYKDTPQIKAIYPNKVKKSVINIIPAFYTAKKGDTLYYLSNKYDISISYIIDLNQLKAPYQLIEGHNYLLPIRSVHMVFPGDTITSIALRYKVSIDSLLNTNKIASKYLSLIPGEEIKLSRIPISALTPNVISTVNTKSKVKSKQNNQYTKNTKTSDIKRKSFIKNNKSVSLALIPVPINKDSSLKEQARVALGKIPNSLLPSAPARSKQTFLKPVNGKIIQKFGERIDGIKQEGINYDVSFRSPVNASENGVVIFSDQSLSALGKLLLIKHSDGFFTAYANIDSLEVTRGDIVNRGQVVAYSGKNSKNNQPQLMFQIRKNRKAINPESLLTP